MKKLLIFLLLFVPMLGKSQMLDPTKWKVSLSKQQVKLNETVDVILTVTIDHGWKLYSLGENPPQASITIDGSGFKASGAIKEGPGIHKGYDDVLEMDVKYYEGKAEFRQTVKITSKNPVINIEVEAQSCPIGPGQCVRVNKSLTVDHVKVTASAEEKNIKRTEDQKVVTPSAGREKESVAGEDSNKTEASNASSGSRLKDLEVQKQQLIRKDSEGRDETVVYLKNFVNKYGSKK